MLVAAGLGAAAEHALISLLTPGRIAAAALERFQGGGDVPCQALAMEIRREPSVAGSRKTPGRRGYLGGLRGYLGGKGRT
jgi:hypothetical protein